MKILVTGSNGNLGQVIVEHLSLDRQDVLQATSRPNATQLLLDFNSEFEPEFRLVDIVIHVARSKTEGGVEREILFLDKLFKRGVRVITIGSLSEYLLEKSYYGQSKSAVSNFVFNQGGVVLTCGLISGPNFKGQIYQISRVLRWLPFVPQISDKVFQFETSTSTLLSTLDKVVEGKTTSRNLFVVDGEERVLFNTILQRISYVNRPRIRIPLKLIYGIAFLAERFGLSYFGRDSLKGLLGEYDYKRLEKLRKIQTN